MLSHYERAKVDNRRILNTGFQVDATFTAPEAAGGQNQIVKIFYADTNLDINPQTGLPIKGRKISAHVHVADLTIGNPAEVAGDWTISFTTATGYAVLGFIESPDLDRTFGMLTFRVKILTIKPPVPPEAP